MWNAGVGPTKDAYSIAENPQFLLRVGPGQGSVWVLLTRHITSIDDFRNNREYITIVAYENGGRKVFYPCKWIGGVASGCVVLTAISFLFRRAQAIPRGDADKQSALPVQDTTRRPSRKGVSRLNVSELVSLAPTDLFFRRRITLAISQYEKSTTIYFTLRAYSRDKFELHQIDSGLVRKLEVSGQWKGLTAGGCPNYPLTYQNNPKYKLTLGSSPKARATVSIELRGPKVYQVGFEVTPLSGEAEKRSSGSYRSGYCAMEVEAMAPGTYLIIPTTFLPSQESPFFLTVKSQNGIKLEEVTNDFEFRP